VDGGKDGRTWDVGSDQVDADGVLAVLLCLSGSDDGVRSEGIRVVLGLLVTVFEHRASVWLGWGMSWWVLLTVLGV
jgi:hypothetical protein